MATSSSGFVVFVRNCNEDTHIPDARMKTFLANARAHCGEPFHERSSEDSRSAMLCIGKQAGMDAIVRAVWLLAAVVPAGNAIASSELPHGAQCRQEIRAVDDQADVDIQAINQLIALLEDEVGDSAIASGGQLDRLRERLGAAKLQRASVIDKQHSDLNAIRARCDRLREDASTAAPDDAAS